VLVLRSLPCGSGISFQREERSLPCGSGISFQREWWHLHVGGSYSLIKEVRGIDGWSTALRSMVSGPLLQSCY